MRRMDELVIGEMVEFPLIMFSGIRRCKLTDHARARTHPRLTFLRRNLVSFPIGALQCGLRATPYGHTAAREIW
jgi:hypothetical protein